MNLETTHEILDLIDQTVVFEGTEKLCEAWLEAQDRKHEYKIKPIQVEQISKRE